MASTHKLKAADWIALRLLYIMVASDPGAAKLPEVKRVINYYEDKLRDKRKGKYRTGHLLPLFELLNKELANDGSTFNNPEVMLTRNMDVKWQHSSRELGDTVILDDNGWRKYGLNT